MTESAVFAAASLAMAVLSAATAGVAADSMAAMPVVAANRTIKWGKLAIGPHLSIWTSVADCSDAQAEV